ncbi:Uncharacterised protein [Vibrio mimicus]|uniref:DUF4272 domain-containing protein n=1 Tax=Vibrio mimicus TaxID=674 RepID=UPI000E0219FB|nr:DUF4272 domain-containing protein [Vibrio mimicus]MBY7676490.1 DUF4272 domain-containing protein [Vibrio mimicus]MBY7728379.1 DUF4272 domain-containing protein [Vibrio mimicus]SUQ23554.1 Uncharacterised protein [Vibrio mimicus]
MENDDDEDYGDIESRTGRKIAERILGILASIGKVHFPEKNSIWMRENGIERYLTKAEGNFISSENPAEKDRVNFSWRAEALASLIWSLNGLSEMPPLNEQFDPYNNELVLKALREPEKFLNEQKRRPESELDDMESFLYHQHWRVRDRLLGFNMAQPSQDDPDISEINPSIVSERRYGMSWVVGYGDTWDEVPTDT